MKSSLPLVALVALGLGCAHTQSDEMTASEHRTEAAKHQDAAAHEQAQFNPAETREVLAPRTPFAEEAPGLHQYNPTAEHLNQADREMARAFEHLQTCDVVETLMPHDLVFTDALSLKTATTQAAFEVAFENERAHALYSRLGFAEHGRRLMSRGI